MTVSVEAPVIAPVHPGPVTTPQTNGAAPRMPATELPEVLREGAMFPTSSGSEENGVSDDPFKLDSKFAYTPRKIKVFTIGAGFSGLLMAHKFQHRFPEMRDIVEHTIFEAHGEVGGTWFMNNYPGVQCDVPAHIYVRTPLSW